nr:T-cell receptor delta chain - mouse [Mus musculus]
QIKTSVQKPDAYIHWYQEKPHKMFAEGTKLIVIPSDKRLDA